MDHHHQLKRPIEDDDDNLNNDEFDVTWGGKRSRYLYTYKLQSPLPQTTADTSESETDSVQTTKTKSTVEVISQKDTSTESCSSNCSCKNSTNTDGAEEFEEFEVRSSSSCHNIHFNSSDSSTVLTNEASQNIIICSDTLPDIDNGHNEDTDNQISTLNTNLPTPACFKKCLQCNKENPNPYFQFCFTCFKHRMEFFGKKPEPKRIKNLNIFLNKNVDSLIKEKNSQKSDLKEIESNNDDVKNKDNLCIICFFNTRNGIINHGKIGHIITCYSCAKRLWSTSNKCPLCNVKIKCVTKMIVV